MQRHQMPCALTCTKYFIPIVQTQTPAPRISNLVLRTNARTMHQKTSMVEKKRVKTASSCHNQLSSERKQENKINIKFEEGEIARKQNTFLFSLKTMILPPPPFPTLRRHDKRLPLLKPRRLHEIRKGRHLRDASLLRLRDGRHWRRYPSIRTTTTTTTTTGALIPDDPGANAHAAADGGAAGRGIERRRRRQGRVLGQDELHGGRVGGLAREGARQGVARARAAAQEVGPGRWGRARVDGRRDLLLAPVERCARQGEEDAQTEAREEAGYDGSGWESWAVGGGREEDGRGGGGVGRG